MSGRKLQAIADGCQGIFPVAGAGLFQLLATSGLVAGAQPETLMGSNTGPKTGIAHHLMVGMDTCIQPGYKLL